MLILPGDGAFSSGNFSLIFLPNFDSASFDLASFDNNVSFFTPLSSNNSFKFFWATFLSATDIPSSLNNALAFGEYLASIILANPFAPPSPIPYVFATGLPL